MRMSGYVTDKSKMNFKSLESLENAIKVINEASLAVNDPQRTMKDSPIEESIAGALGAGAGAGVSFAALYFGGTVGLSAAGISSGLAAAGSIIGGGMAAGIAVLAAPIAIGGCVAAVWVAKSKAEKLAKAKELAYKDALREQTAIQKALKEEAYADKDRIDTLTGLNILLQKIIKELEQDLGL